jgi:hypothetical protein
MDELTCMLYVSHFIEALGSPNKIFKNRVSGTYDFCYSNFSFTYCPISRIHGYDGDEWEIEFHLYNDCETICFQDTNDFNEIVTTLKEA